MQYLKVYLYYFIKKKNKDQKTRSSFVNLFIQDVVLNRVLDDPTFATINSLIFFNNVEIVSQLQNDSKLIGDMYVICGVRGGVGVCCVALRRVASAWCACLAITLSTFACLRSVEVLILFCSFTKLKSDTTSTQRKDTLLFIHEMCNLAKNLQIPNRIQLYKYLPHPSSFHLLLY